MLRRQNLCVRTCVLVEAGISSDVSPRGRGDARERSQTRQQSERAEVRRLAAFRGLSSGRSVVGFPELCWCSYMAGRSWKVLSPVVDPDCHRQGEGKVEEVPWSPQTFVGQYSGASQHGGLLASSFQPQEPWASLAQRGLARRARCACGSGCCCKSWERRGFRRLRRAGAAGRDLPCRV